MVSRKGAVFVAVVLGDVIQTGPQRCIYSPKSCAKRSVEVFELRCERISSINSVGLRVMIALGHQSTCELGTVIYLCGVYDGSLT